MIDIEKFKTLGFNKSQIRQIEIGIKNHLSEEQINRYAKIEYPARQMESIREAIEYNLSDEQIEMFCEKRYSEEEVYEMLFGFHYGHLDVEDVKLFLKPVYSFSMQPIRTILEKCKEGKFNKQQAFQIRLGLQHELPAKTILKYAKPSYSFVKMLYMRLGYEHNLTEKQMDLLDTNTFSAEQLDEILSGFTHGLTFEQVQKYAKIEYTMPYMRQLRLAYEHGCTDEQVDFLINVIDNIYDWLIDPFEDNLTGSPYKTGVYVPEEPYDGGLRHTEDSDTIAEFIKCFSIGLSIDDVEKMRNISHMLPEIQLMRFALTHGYSFNDIEVLFPKDKWCSYSYDERDVLFHALCLHLNPKALSLIAASHLNTFQRIVILEGFLAGLTYEQVNVYAKPVYRHLQMSELKTALLDGLSMEEVNQLANPRLSSVDMALKRTEILKTHSNN